jgi:uncharacterized lipoprotein YajG
MNRLRHSIFLLAAAASIFLAGCSTHRASLDYDPEQAHGLRPGSGATISVGSFADKRDLPDNYLGQIREAAGPLQKKIETNVPVSQIVGNTFAYGLQHRKMLSSGKGGKYVLGGIIREFSCDQVLRAGASAEIAVTLTAPGAEKPAFRKTYTAERSEATVKLGVLGDPQKLRDLASRTLQELVDKALDDPDLRQITDAE